MNSVPVLPARGSLSHSVPPVMPSPPPAPTSGRRPLALLGLFVAPADLSDATTPWAALRLQVKRWARDRRTEGLLAHPAPAVRPLLRLIQLDGLRLEGAQ